MSVSQFAAVWIGVSLVSIGAFATAAWALRGRRDGPILLSFGAWAALYGVRLLALQPPVRAALGVHPLGWSYFPQFVTYAINVPAMYFFVAILGTGWRRTMLWVVVIEAAYGVAAIAIDLAAGRPGAAGGPNNPIVLTGISI